MVLQNTWQKCKCNRCGFQWSPREPWSMSGAERAKYLPKRCASCRSPYWNKPYVRNNANRAPGSIGFQATLPFPTHDAGTVRIKTIPKVSKAGLAASAALRKLSKDKRLKVILHLADTQPGAVRSKQISRTKKHAVRAKSKR